MYYGNNVTGSANLMEVMMEFGVKKIVFSSSATVYGECCNLKIFFFSTKAEYLQEGIFFLIHLFATDVLVMKKLEIEKTKPTFIISVLKVEY